MKKSLEYNPAFDILFDCLSSEREEVKNRLQKYVAHRYLYGRQAASRIYPDCHNIIIIDPELKLCWTELLKTVDSLSNARQ